MITRFSKYDEYLTLQKQANRKFEEIKELVDKFINLNQSKWEEWDIESYYKCFDIEINYEREWVDIEYYQYRMSEEDMETRLSFGDFRNFLEFMKDPDMYVNVKKFNL